LRQFLPAGPAPARPEGDDEAFPSAKIGERDGSPIERTKVEIGRGLAVEAGGFLV
jgi:hypothetical protein